MADIRIENSDYIKYVIQREELSSYMMDEEPLGWDDDELEVVRNEKYHGVFTQFTGGLGFRGYAKDFILDTYKLGGLNANLYLFKYRLKEVESYIVGGPTELKWVRDYRGLADWETLTEKDGTIQLNFISDELERLVKSHESDEFRIDRLTDIDGNGLSIMNANSTFLNGRILEAEGEQENVFTSDELQRFGDQTPWFTVPTIFINKAFDRHVEVNNEMFDTNSNFQWQGNFFYNRLIDSVPIESSLRIEIDIDMHLWMRWGFPPPNITQVELYLQKYKYDENGYSEDGAGILLGTYSNNSQIVYNGVVNIGFDEVANNNSFAIVFKGNTSADDYLITTYTITTYNVKVREQTRFISRTPKYKFYFVNEVAGRLMEIITGKTNKFYSKLFGRNFDYPPPSTGFPAQYQPEGKYAETGEQGFIGLISGLDIRSFTETNPLYKGLTTSLRKLIESMQSQFNIGVEIEDSEFGQRLRFEKMSYYYQDEVGLKLPNQVTNVTRRVEKKMFSSGFEFGSDKGGDYELDIGLSEPNVKTSYVGPLRKTANKYIKLCDYRSDDTMMEIMKRHPEWLGKDEDRNEDEHVWLLDLKLIMPEYDFSQLNWNDALAELPEGVYSPETYRSWKFTPKRSMLRHGWTIRAGMEQDVNMSKVITVAKSDANINLRTKYINEDWVSESSDELIGGLEVSKVLPEIINFTHPMSDRLLDVFRGTKDKYYGGEVEEIPMYYFKIEFLNENEEWERGYVRSFKPKKGEFEVIKANESLLYGEDIQTLPLTFSSFLTMDGHFDIRVGGAGYIDWGDGTQTTNFSGESVLLSHYYNNFNGTISFYGSLTRLHSNTATANLNHNIGNLPSEMLVYVNAGVNTTTGDVATLPSGLLSYLNEGSNTTSGSLDELPSGLLAYLNKGNNTVSGDISDLNPNISIFDNGGLNTVDSYSSPVSWSGSLWIFKHKPTAGNGLTATEVDNLLIDFASAGMMEYGVIDLSGNNAGRTSASDTAVTDLENMNITVITN